MHQETPEEYQVLHVGPENEAALDQTLVNEARGLKKRRISKLVLLALVCGVGFFAMSSLKGTIEKNELQISSLIDEVGNLSQSNLELYNKVESQEAVLQSIEGGFTELGQALESSDDTALQQSFLTLLSRFSSASGGELFSESAGGNSTDSTFDILILGTNGAHTDTIMIASINEDKQKASIFSVPRDLYISGRRINEYYTYYGEEELERMLKELTGLQIDRFVQVDLNGFVDIVDEIGGLDIYVPKSIYDGYYPNSRGGYSAYSIEKGQYHMKGDEALKYARSRKSTSDFDRAARQQSILAALRTKMIQLDGVMDMKEITELMKTGLESTSTDITLLDLVSYYYDYQSYSLSTGFVLSTDNYLYSMINQSGAYILLPNTGNFDEIHGVISKLVN